MGERVWPMVARNQRFPRLLVEKSKPIPIVLKIPADGSRAVLVSVNHGGRIDGDQVTRTFELGPDRTVRFSFTPSDQSGLFQVGLQRGTYQEALEFWVPTGLARVDEHALR